MKVKKNNEKLHKVWLSLKPFLILLLLIAVLLAIALLIIALVEFFDDKNITFLILVIVDFSVLGIFAIGFMAFGFKYVISIFIEKEEEKCIYCGKALKVHAKFCPECGNELR